MDSFFIYLSDLARQSFYTALLEADVTLVSIFGLFIIFKAQFFLTLAANFRVDLYKSSGEELNDRIDAFNFDYSPQEERDKVINEEILNDAEKIKDGANWNKFNLLINDKFSKFIMNKAKLPMLLFLLAIIWNILGIVFFCNLNVYRLNKTPEMLFIYVTIIYQICLLIYMAYVMYKYLLNDSWKKEVSLLEDRKIRDLKNRTEKLRESINKK